MNVGLSVSAPFNPSFRLLYHLLDNYMQSDLFKGFGSFPHIKDLDIKLYQVLNGLGIGSPGGGVAPGRDRASSTMGGTRLWSTSSSGTTGARPLLLLWAPVV